MNKTTHRLLLLIGLALAFSCKSPSDKNSSEPYRIAADELQKTVSYLASDELLGRDTGSEGIEKAARYIENQLEKFKLQPYYTTYRDSFDFQDKAAYNIVAYKAGTHPELKQQTLVLGAHYDHIGVIDAKDGDSIANGANDNAAGSAGLLELAKYFSSRKTNRSLLFVFFSAEEKGLVGSRHLAKRMKDEGNTPELMLNFEMIGVPMQNRAYKVYLTGYEVSNLAERINALSNKKLIGNWSDAETYQLFKRSDNYAFFQELNIPAHTVSSFDFKNFDHYHQVGDESDLLDYDFMKELMEEMAVGIDSLANTKELKIQLRND